MLNAILHPCLFLVSGLRLVPDMDLRPVAAGLGRLGRDYAQLGNADVGGMMRQVRENREFVTGNEIPRMVTHGCIIDVCVSNCCCSEHHPY
jgi:hypothetical protein